MDKNYVMPEIEVVEMELQSPVLEESDGGGTIDPDP
jgi:hypothetical protein